MPERMRILKHLQQNDPFMRGLIKQSFYFDPDEGLLASGKSIVRPDRTNIYTTNFLVVTRKNERDLLDRLPILTNSPLRLYFWESASRTHQVAHKWPFKTR